MTASQPTRTRAPRQSDVARLAGVSQSAVSMVIRGGDAELRIPETTRARIRDAIAELGYVPNPVARSLRGKRTQLLGVHTFEPLFPSPRESFYFQFLLGVEARAEETGHDLVLFSSTGDGAGARRIYRDERNRLGIADGSVLLGVSDDKDELARLWHEGYPFVHIGRREVPGAPFPCIVPDYRDAAGEVVALLREHGHRGFVYLRDDLDLEPYADRRSGYREAIAALGIEDRSPGTVEDRPGLPPESLRPLLDGTATAVVAESRRLAETLQRELAPHGLRIPEDVSVVVLESTDEAETAWDDLRIPRIEIGRLAVDHLIVMIEEPDAPRESVLVRCSIEPGATVTVARSRS